MTTAFETETCPRCGGSGKYSYNQMHGDRCYGCGGSGKRHTKRGSVAREFFQKLLEKPVSEVKVGDQIRGAVCFLGPDRWCLITSIGPDMGAKYEGENFGDRIRVDFKRGTKESGLGGLRPTSIVQSVRDEAERQQHIAAAIAYQSTLTKTGKPRKQAA